MYRHYLHFELGCKNCLYFYSGGITTFETETEAIRFSDEELLDIVDNFSAIICPKCNHNRSWQSLKMAITDANGVRKRFKINLYKENHIIWGKPEDGLFSPAEIDMAIISILDKIKKLEANHFPANANGSAKIVVDILSGEPYFRVSSLELKGITTHELVNVIKEIRDNPKEKLQISISLKKRLECAFEGLKSEPDKAVVISRLKDKNDNINIYLIAKKPNQEIYFGIIDLEIETIRQIEEISISTIQTLVDEEVPIKAFRALPFIENGVQ
jgi:hypothetical protein